MHPKIQSRFNSIYQDFNGSSGDLGGDTQSLKEGGLLRTQPSVLSRHSHITGGDGTGTSSSWHLTIRWLIQYACFEF